MSDLGGDEYERKYMQPGDRLLHREKVVSRGGLPPLAGVRLTIGSETPEQLAEAIQSALRVSAARVRVADGASSAAAAEAEAPAEAIAEESEAASRARRCAGTA